MKKERTIALALLTALLMFLLAACATPTAAPTQAPAGEQPAAPEATQPPAAEAPAGDQKYGLFMSHMTNAFTIELSDAVKAKAQELGVDLTVYDGGNDAAKQISQVETAVSQGITAIIIEPVSVDGITPAIQAARDAGIPVVTVNQKITQQDLANAFVGVSHVEGGELEMRTALEAIGGEGNIAILLGPLGSDAQIGRQEGYEKVLAENPNVTVAFEQTANWKTDEALKLVENWLQTGTELKAIVAQNDGMAMGALKAVEDAQLQDQIKVYGLDATPDALAAVQDGSLAATVSQSTTEQGTKAMEAAYKIVNGEQVDPEILVGHTLITAENVGEFIK